MKRPVKWTEVELRLTISIWRCRLGRTKRRMKTPLITITTGILFGVRAFAGPETIIKERAKELSNQNNVRQGVAPPTQPALAPNAPAPPTVTPALARFQTELSTLSIGTPATPDQKQKLTQDLLLAPQGAKPSRASLAKLTEDLSAAFAEKPLSPASRARFVQELDAVLNPGRYPQARLDGIFKDVQAIFQDNGLSRNKAVAIAEDVKAISDQIQKGGV